jgi:hypothetical protein
LDVEFISPNINRYGCDSIFGEIYMGKPKNYWKDINNVLTELQSVHDELGHFPSVSELEKLGYNSLSISIYKYHGGMGVIRGITGNESTIKPREYWFNIENIKREATLFIEEHGVAKFTYKHMRSVGLHNFVNGIKRQGISLTQVCEMIGVTGNFTPKGYLEDLGNILHEARLLVEKYGCIPPAEILVLEGKSSITAMMQRHHGGMKELYRLIGYSKPSSLSSLEISVKHMLDDMIDDARYVDNGRKDLLKYGVDLKNSLTDCYLELDRFYYDARVAIEIHGKQHYTGTKHKAFGDDVVKRTKKNDSIKANLLRDQGVELIEIPFNRCSRSYITQLLRDSGRLKLKPTKE